MPTFTIKDRFTKNAIYSASADTEKAFFAGVPLGTNLTNADLSGKEMSGLNWAGMTLTNANLTEGNLTDTKLHGATLTNADCTRANLENTNFHTATVTSMITTNAKTKGVKGI